MVHTEATLSAFDGTVRAEARGLFVELSEAQLDELIHAILQTRRGQGTAIRGDFGVSNSFNLIHGSDSEEAASKELELFFADGEVQEYTLGNLNWIYDASEEL